VYHAATQSYQLPEFRGGNGPLGVFTLLHDNAEAKVIMDQCDAVFDQFCDTVRKDILDEPHKSHSQQPSTMDHWILRSPPTSHHITVAILQEHPSFLRNDPEALANWQPISNDTIATLAAKYAHEHPKVVSSVSKNDNNGLPRPPRLQLDSLLWTPDGALIAGFVDDNDNAGIFDRLRQSSRSIAQDVLGDVLTTRPKNLIHATVGRMMGLPPGASMDQYQTLRELARHYNQDVLPETVQRIILQQQPNSKTHNGGGFDLNELSLARNAVWMMKEYVEYARWKLYKD